MHRNWKAITYNLPIKDWYYDSTSQWTLDYPPLFAAFEFVLAQVASLLNLHETLNLTDSEVRHDSTVAYQKFTVIVSDFAYYYAIYEFCRALEPIIQVRSNKTKKNDPAKSAYALKDLDLYQAFVRPSRVTMVALVLTLQPGLLLVDHVHFQYNGFLTSILLLSMTCVIRRRYASGCFWFALLLNFKHIYLYYAPGYGMYFISSYCMHKRKSVNRVGSFIRRTLGLGFIVVIVFVITYAPFADIDTLKQILSRLFPFKRGLTHAYWAPNVWSLYNTADKILATLTKHTLKAKFDLESISKSSSTSGLVQEYEHQYLPSIRPLTTLCLVGLFTAPLVMRFLLKTNVTSSVLFLKGITIAAFTSFMFGWHVHEKAIILVTIPLAAAAFMDRNLHNVLLRLTLAGTYSLLPLLFRPAEYVTKVTILIASYCFLKSLKPSDEKRSTSLYNRLDNLYTTLIILVEIYITLFHHLILSKYNFLPLMLVSSSSAIGLTASYLELYYDFMSRDVEEDAAAAAAA